MNKQVLRLLNTKQYRQRTKEWYNIRVSLITASSASCLLVRDSITCDSYIKTYELEDIFDKNGKCCNPYSSKEQYLIDKFGTDNSLKSVFQGNVATFWGQKYEPVASDIYSLLVSREILEFGLILHPEFKWLAASPDGIRPDGVMVEIKCPYRRKITGIPPFYYWIQCQIQMEVCNLEVCDFVEYDFMEFKSVDEFLDDETLEVKCIHKGLFIRVGDLEENCKYFYPKKYLIDNIVGLISWKNKFLSTHSFPNIQVIYWKLIELSVVSIKRDRIWFENIRHFLEEEYNKAVLGEIPEKEKTKEIECIF